MSPRSFVNLTLIFEQSLLGHAKLSPKISSFDPFGFFVTPYVGEIEVTFGPLKNVILRPESCHCYPFTEIYTLASPRKSDFGEIHLCFV